jgi:predicted DNA binding CopG/RHH family protein
MNREEKPIDSPRDIPAGLSDEERMAFLEEHGVSEYFLENAEEASEEERPRPRTKPVNIRFDEFTLGRLKALAASRNVGYQTLLKTFVQERLYEEEKRTWTTPSQQAPVEQPTKQRSGDCSDPQDPGTIGTE